MKKGLIEFDGEVLTYPNGNKIYINYDTEWDCYTFDVVSREGFGIKEDMSLLQQAHNIATGDIK